MKKIGNAFSLGFVFLLALSLACWNTEEAAQASAHPPGQPPADPPPFIFGQTPDGGETPPTYEAVTHQTLDSGEDRWTMNDIGETLTLHDGGGSWEGTLDDGDPDTSDSITIESGSYADIRGIRIYIGTAGDDSYATDYEGRNIIIGLSGNDKLWGNKGRDYIFGGAGRNVLYGGAGDDFLDLSNSDELSNSATGGPGNDYIIGSPYNDILIGDSENGQMGYGAYIDYIWTGNGIDKVDAGPGSDTIYVTSSAGVFIGGGESDELYIYTGSECTFIGDYEEDSDDDVWAAGYNFDDDSDDHPGIDYFTVYNTTGRTQFYCGPCNDTVKYGGKHADMIRGQAGGDTLDGGPNEIDTPDDPNTKNVNEHVDNHDEIIGGDGDDFVFGNSGDDRCYGNSGSDQIWGGSGDDKLSGGEGADFIWGDLSDIPNGGPQADVSYDDVIDGKEDNDYLRGDWGNDVIHCGTGSDTAFGDEGNDRIHGDIGSDYLYGNEGEDVLIDHSREIDTLIGGDGSDKVSCWDDLVQNPSNGVDYVRGDDPLMSNNIDEFWLDDGDDSDVQAEPELADPNQAHYTIAIAEDVTSWKQVSAAKSVKDNSCS